MTMLIRILTHIIDSYGFLHDAQIKFGPVYKRNETLTE